MTQEKTSQLLPEVLNVDESTGVGDVFFEHIQMTCQKIQGFKFTGESKPIIIYELIKDVEQGKVKLNGMTANEMMVF